MKNIFLLFLIFPFLVFPQDYKKFRMNIKQKNQLTIQGDFSLFNIEKYLDENENILQDDLSVKCSTGLTNLNDPSPYIEKLKTKNIKNICIDCYVYEYESQLKRLKEITNRLKDQEDRKAKSQDSIFAANRKQIEIWKKQEQSRKDSLEYLANNQNVTNKDSIERFGYNWFIFNLDGIYPNLDWARGCITPFVGVDWHLASMRFSIYMLSNDYSLDDDNCFDYPNKKIISYVPQIQYGDNHERCRIICNTKVDISKPSYIAGEKCQLITSVSIQGSTDAILNIFIKYWQTSLKISSNIGVIATYRFMGDLVSLKRIRKGVLQIDISRNPNMEWNYYKMYKIK